jgi:hypothetical protein
VSLIAEENPLEGVDGGWIWGSWRCAEGFLCFPFCEEGLFVLMPCSYTSLDVDEVLVAGRGVDESDEDSREALPVEGLSSAVTWGRLSLSSTE